MTRGNGIKRGGREGGKEDRVRGGGGGGKCTNRRGRVENKTKGKGRWNKVLHSDQKPLRKGWKITK